MKKIFKLIILFSIISIFQILLFQKASADVNSRMRIDIELDNCLQKNQDYNKKIQCTNIASIKYKNEINEALLRLKPILTQSQYEELMLSQKAWEDYKNKNNKMLEKLLEDNNQAELKYESAKIKCDTIKKQAYDLIYLYFNLYYIKNDIK